jgi:hypothetical protein
MSDGDNLGKTKVVNAYVVYDVPEDPTKNTTAEASAKATDEGRDAGPKQDRVVASGKLWSTINKDGGNIPKADSAQISKWVEGVVVENDEIEEEFDKWTKWTTIKNGLRSGDVEIKGPEHIKKEGFTYRLPVPMGPPKIDVAPSVAGVKIEIEGGGAVINNSYPGGGEYTVVPQQYYIYRKIIAEPERTKDDDLYDWWDTPPSAPGNRTIMTDTAVTQLDGSPTTPPNSSLPVASSYTEPHDSSPEDQPRDAEFSRIAEVDNSEGDNDIGKGTFLDTDVEDTAEYEYYATAVYGDQESTDSNHDTATFTGSSHRSYRMINKPTAVDAIAPNDPAYPDQNFGEMVIFDVPASFDIGDFENTDTAKEIIDRQSAVNRAADFRIRLTVLNPLLGLEWGQKVSVPSVSWRTFANDIDITTEMDNDSWMLIGFSRYVDRTKAGKWRSQDTVLQLQERPKPQ